jgi:hypothetical protein
MISSNGNARRDRTTASDQTLTDVDIEALNRALKMVEDDAEVGPKFLARLERGEPWDAVAKDATRYWQLRNTGYRICDA